jgi:ribosome maturation factor RimP
MVLQIERKGIEKKFFELSQKVVAEQGFELYDMEYFPGSGAWRIYIYNEKTNTAVIEDCIKVDRALTPYIEEADWMPDNLVLQVSSPGIDRFLKTKEHFERAVGQRVRLVLAKRLGQDECPEMPKSLKGEKKVVAKLESLDDDGLSLLYRDEYAFFISYEELKKASVDPIF